MSNEPIDRPYANVPNDQFFELFSLVNNARGTAVAIERETYAAIEAEHRYRETMRAQEERDLHDIAIYLANEAPVDADDLATMMTPQHSLNWVKEKLEIMRNKQLVGVLSFTAPMQYSLTKRGVAFFKGQIDSFNEPSQ